MELLKYGTPESREAQDRMIKHLEQAIHELDEAERLIKQMDDPMCGLTRRGSDSWTQGEGRRARWSTSRRNGKHK